MVVEADPNDDAFEIDASRRRVADRSCRPDELVDLVGDAGIRNGIAARAYGELRRGRYRSCDRVYRSGHWGRGLP